MQERIEAQLESADSLPNILISLEPENHQGVAGITAGYLSGKYYLPAIVGKTGPDRTTASCRSIPEFDMVAALEANRDLLDHFGGHTLAAGFTIDNQNIPEFETRLQSLAKDLLSDLVLSPALDIDALVTLTDLNLNLHKELLKLEPTGEGNPQPIFALQDVFAQNADQVGASGDHLKLIISDGTDTMPAIGFGLGSLASTMPDRFDVAFHFNENEYRGMKEFQLQILDLKPH
jgi:single-stranded-DNA-specific exonuclease